MRAKSLLGALCLLFVAGCFLENPGGGGPGGQGVDFSEGFVFVRPDDKNLFVADKSDFQTRGQLTTGGGVSNPSLSKDGRQIVYIQATSNGTDLMVMSNAAGSTPSKLLSSTATQKRFRNPVFFPDGTKIGFTFDEGTYSAIGTVNADGSGFSKIIGSGTLSFGSLSAVDNLAKSLYAMAGNSFTSYSQIHAISLNGTSSSESSNLGPIAKISQRAVVSPDGKRVAFDGQLSSGGSRIFVMDLGTKVVTQLTDYPAEPTASDSNPTWVGNTSVGFSSDVGGTDQVYVLAADQVKTSGGIKLPSAIEPWYGPN